VRSLAIGTWVEPTSVEEFLTAKDFLSDALVVPFSVVIGDRQQAHFSKKTYY
jgi:hypothetical protein